jgi:phenylalanyl-tRNA synthetase beta chain
MKISLNWLKTLLETNHSADELSAMLTAAGLEVEGRESFDSVPGGMKGLVIGEVIECTKHPDADRLSLTKVTVGNGAPLSIVCGAPNVAQGQKVVVATVGARLHPVTGEPFEIKKSKIRGQLSEGMLCAEDEIGIGQSHAGIIVLPPDSPVGLPVSTLFEVESDEVLEIGLTPNRSDAASHFGVARDLAAIMNSKENVHTYQAKIPGTGELPDQ